MIGKEIIRKEPVKILDIVSGRVLRISGVSDLVKEKKERRDIISIDLGDDILYKINQEIPTKYGIYKIKRIVRELYDSNGKFIYALVVDKKNKTTRFLLPMFGDSMGSFFETYFINAYLDVEDIDKKTDTLCLYLLYRFRATKEYLDFEEKLQNHEQYRGHYEPDKHHTIYLFEIPDEYIDEYRLFLKGKYSEFSNDYKYQIMKFFNFDAEGDTFQILNRGDRRRKKIEEDLGVKIPKEIELEDKPSIVEETYTEDMKISENILR